MLELLVLHISECVFVCLSESTTGVLPGPVCVCVLVLPSPLVPVWTAAHIVHYV